MNNSIPNHRGSSVPWLWVFLLLGLSLLRLLLTGDRDIIATNAPHDEFWYVHRAFAGLWTGQYDQMAFVHPPVYVWWLQLLNAFGIPLRLGIDAALVAATLYLAMAVNRFTGSRVAALAVAAFLLFHPYTVFIFDRALAETLLVVTITAGLAAALEIWTTRGSAIAGRRLLAVLLFPLMFAVAFHLRKEGIALLVPFLMLAMLTFASRKTWWTKGASGEPSAGVLLIVSPLVATICLGLIISYFNYFKWGTFARYDLANTGYADAVSALSRIDTGRTPLQVSVTRQMLAAGYAASPTLKEIEPSMEGPVGQQWRDISSPFVAAKGEIGNGWFYWAVRDAAASAGWHTDAKTAEQKYGAVAKELRAAFASGKLKERTALLPSFVDPDFRKWLPALPASVANVTRISALPLASDVSAPTDNPTPQQFREYSSVTGRSQPLPLVEMQGWIIAPAGTLAGFASGDAEPEWAPISANARPDVPGAFAIKMSSQGIAQPDRIVFKSPAGTRGHVLISDLHQGTTATVVGDFATAIGVDMLSAGGVQRLADSSLGWQVHLARAGSVFFGVCLLLALIVAAFQRKTDGLLNVAMACVLICLARVGLFALVDASSWSGAQARYMMPILPLIALSGALGFVYLLRRAKATFGSRDNATPVEG